MNKKRMPLIILLLFLLISSGCGRSTHEAAAPQATTPEPQASTSANIDDTPIVSIGPPIQEYYDPNQPELKIQMVYVTTDPGLNYHRLNCKFLLNGKIALGLEEAKEEGYTPCTICKPSQ